MPNQGNIYKTGININQNADAALKGILKSISDQLDSMGAEQFNIAVGMDIDKQDVQNKLNEIKKLLNGTFKDVRLSGQFSELFKGLAEGTTDLKKATKAVNELYNQFSMLKSLPKADLDKLSGLSATNLNNVVKQLKDIEAATASVNEKVVEAMENFNKASTSRLSSLSGLSRSNAYKGAISSVKTDVPVLADLETALSSSDLAQGATLQKSLKSYENYVAIYRQLSSEMSSLLVKAKTGEASPQELFNAAPAINSLKELRAEIVKIEAIFKKGGISSDLLASNAKGLGGSSYFSLKGNGGGLTKALDKFSEEYEKAFRNSISDSIVKLKENLSADIDRWNEAGLSGVKGSGDSGQLDKAQAEIEKYIVSIDEAIAKINELDEKLTSIDIDEAEDTDDLKTLKEYADTQQEMLKYYASLRKQLTREQLDAVLPDEAREFDANLNNPYFVDEKSLEKFRADVKAIREYSGDMFAGANQDLSQAEAKTEEIKQDLSNIEKTDADALVNGLNKAEQTSENIEKNIKNAGVMPSSPTQAGETGQGAPSIKVEPEIDPAYFIGEIQRQIDASGGSVKIPVELADEDVKSEITRVSESIGKNISDSVAESIKQNLNIGQAIQQTVDNTVQAAVEEQVKAATETAIKEVEKATKKTSKTAGKSGAKSSQKSSSEIAFDKQIKQYDALIKKTESYYKLRQKYASSGLTENELIRYSALDSQFKELDNFLKTVSTQSDEARENVNALAKSFENAKKEAATVIQDSTISTLENRLSGFQSRAGNRAPGFTTEITNIAEMIQRLKAMGPVNLLNDDEIQEWGELRNRINEAFKTLRQNESRYGDVNIDSLNAARASFENFVRRNSSLSTDSVFGPQIQSIRSMFDTAQWQGDLDNAISAVTRLRAETTALNKTGQSFGDIWTDKMRSMVAWMASFGSVYDVINRVQDGIQAIVEYDTALTNLGKVANATTNQLREFGQSAYDVANGIGATNVSVIEAAGEWARLGYAIQEAGELARASTIYANVGELPADEATKTLVSTLKAFQMNADEAMNVVDVLNEIGNRYATSSSELGDILQRSAAAMSVAGDDLEGVVAIGTGMQEILQNAESVGTTLKTLSMRIRATKSEIVEAGLDADGMANSTSELREQILALTNVTGKGGFDIIDPETGGYKTILEILNGVAEVYDRMSSLDQAALLELMAGKRGGNALAAAISNIDTINEVYETAQNAEGSAERENERYVESIQGQLNILENQWNELWTTGFNQDVMLFFIDLGQAILEVADNVGILGLALGGLAGVGIFKDLGRLDLRAA